VPSVALQPIRTWNDSTGIIRVGAIPQELTIVVPVGPADAAVRPDNDLIRIGNTALANLQPDKESHAVVVVSRIPTSGHCLTPTIRLCRMTADEIGFLKGPEMRSKLAKEVRSRFEAALRKALPQFSVTRDERVPSGGTIFAWRIRDDFYALILLQMGRRDEFTIEGAWSRNARFPFNELPGFPVDLPSLGFRRDEPGENGIRFRLVTLWDPRQNQFWELVPQPTPDEWPKRLELVSQGLEVDPPVEAVLEAIPTAVGDAVQKIVVHAVPYWLSAAQAFQKPALE
jgi:hypothetical protein